MQLPNHGANPHTLYARLGLTMPASIMDFSENCNPAGPPAAVFQHWEQLYPSITRYPDPSGEPFLTAISAYHAVEPHNIILGNGAAELLSLLAAQYRDRRAILIDPAFSEYEATLTAAGARITRIQAREEDGFTLPADAIEAALPDADVLYLCTPSNPTGLLPAKEELLRLIQSAAKHGCDVIVDEAFIDWVGEEHSLIPHLDEFLHVTIVRSMTKLYAIPGIRLGYAIASRDRITSLRRHAPHWNVNAVAARIGALCLGQEEYRQKAVRHAAGERRKMTEFLEDHGCTVLPSVTNYLLFQPPAGIPADIVFRRLLVTGIAVRHTENFKGLDGRWLRIGMKTEHEMKTLRASLDACFAEGTLTFICGGVRSGKSAYAEQLVRTEAEKTGGRLIYIASGTPSDAEMADRIARHQQDRAHDGWTTIEQPVDLAQVMPQLQPGDHVLWDCATTWLANAAFEGWESGTPCIQTPGCLGQKLGALLGTIRQIRRTARQLVIVSNEVFDEPLNLEQTTRDYTKALGSLHQRIAADANTAIEMDSGIPVYHKGGLSR